MNSNAERRAFRNWATKNRELLLATGIPLVAWDSLQHWGYFLDHSCLPYDVDPSGFDVEQLSLEQLTALRELLARDAPYAKDASITAHIQTLIQRKSHGPTPK